MTTASLDDISGWFDEALAMNATHMLIINDGFDHDDYPVYISLGTDPRHEANRVCDHNNMQYLMECYAMHLSKNEQLSERRAYHFEANPDVPGYVIQETP